MNMSALDPTADLAWKIAAAEAGEGRHVRILPAHLLIGLLSFDKVASLAQPGGNLTPELLNTVAEERDAIERSLMRSGAAPALRRQLRKRVGLGGFQHGSTKISRNPAVKAAFTRAAALAGGAATRARHLLAALLEGNDPLVLDVLAAEGIDPAHWRKALLDGAETEKAQAYLDRFGRDLTRLAEQKALGPVIGRRTEILQIVQTLARSSKNNPLLVGEAGVGKTAIVEALALRAVAGKEAQVLGGKRIIELNMGALLGGTQYRGELEERLQRIMEEVRAQPEVIVFIDEIHTVVGAGRVSGGGADAANLMKPALARGDFCCIGATTPEEYQRYIESDAALERRFEKIQIGEPSRAETLEILRGLRPRWEEHHAVRLGDAALEAATDLAVRFDLDHRLPDKAIDLIDKAAARTRLPALSMQAPESEAAPLPKVSLDEVTPLHVAQVLAEKHGLPLELVAEGLSGLRRSRMLDLETKLRAEVVGQDPAIARICRRLQLAYAGLGREHGPLAVFLLLGPSGVGKTETAIQLARNLFEGEQSLIRLDMSEYMESHSISRLIGAPPGYVGHDEEGQLTSRLRTRPHSLVLLDEIEKADPGVFDLFLQVFDAGRITDSKGRTADARQALFVMTSNLGAGGVALGFRGSEATREDEREELRKHFRPEFLNRIDEIVHFEALTETSAQEIVRHLLARIGERLRNQHGVSLSASGEAEGFLVERGWSATLGARELARTVERFVQAPLSSLILDGKIRRSLSWRLVYDEGGLYVVPDERPSAEEA
jgi:ATP-dependent Clp protease ATP-binding subunit ClpC